MQISNIFFMFIGGFVGFLISHVESANYRIQIAEQEAQIILQDHMIKQEIPAIHKKIEIAGNMVSLCNETAAKMGVIVSYPALNNRGMGG